MLKQEFSKKHTCTLNRGGPFSFSFYSTIMLSFLKNISNKSIFRNYLDIFDRDIDTNKEVLKRSQHSSSLLFSCHLTSAKLSAQLRSAQISSDQLRLNNFISSCLI